MENFNDFLQQVAANDSEHHYSWLADQCQATQPEPNPIWLAEQLFKNFNPAQQTPTTTPATETAQAAETAQATETATETATATATDYCYSDCYRDWACASSNDWNRFVCLCLHLVEAYES